MGEAPCIERIAEAARGGLGGELGANSDGRIGVGEEDRAECDGTRSGGDQLERVEPGADSAHADDGQLDGRGAGVDAGERDRLEGRSRVAAHAPAERRPERPLVERKAAEGVDEREPVGAGGLDGARRLGDVPRCRRELRVERQVGGAPAGRDDLGRALRRLVDVRAGQVQLDRDVLEGCAGLGVVARREAADRHPERHPELAQPRQRLREEALAAGVRQPDRVQHPGLRLGDPDGRVALARGRRDRLRDEGVEGARDLGRGERVEAAGGVEGGGEIVA